VGAVQRQVRLTQIAPNYLGGAILFINDKAHSQVTHIVASQLPHSKIQKIVHAQNPKFVVKPDWIVACVEAGILLRIVSMIVFDTSLFRSKASRTRLPAHRRCFIRRLCSSGQFGQSAIFRPCRCTCCTRHSRRRGFNPSIPSRCLMRSTRTRCSRQRDGRFTRFESLQVSQQRPL
jgi:hypothetical protein